MMKTLSALFQTLLPPRNGDDPYSWRVSVYLTLLALIIVCAGSLLAMHGGFAWAGLADRVAWSSEVDDKIARAVEPITEKLESMEKTGQAILRAQYLPQIRAKVRERCDTTDRRERAKINAELDRIRQEYERFAGEPLNSYPTCDEV